MLIHIGYSDSLSFADFMSLLDVEGDEPRMQSFRRAFGTGYIRPGDYEIYPREDTPEEFNPETIRQLMPFEPGDLQLFTLDLAQRSLVFYIRDECEWVTERALEIIVTDTIEIEKFDYE